MPISAQAIVHPKATLGTNVDIGPFAIVEEGVEIGDNCCLSASAIVRKGTILKKNVFVDSFAVIGGHPQVKDLDLQFPSGVIIGENVRIREGVTVHRSMHKGKNTIVGDHCFLMAYAHIAHDCQIGHHVIITNSVLLAGHVNIDSYAFLGGNAIIHQFVHVGESVMVGGGAELSTDVAPFLLAAKRNEVFGLNLIGLKRRGFSPEMISKLKTCYTAVYKSSSLGSNALAAEKEGLGNHCSQAQQFLDFFKKETPRGFAQSAS